MKKRKRGMYLYVPKSAVEELNKIMEFKNLGKAPAFKEMASYSKVGREAENILKLRFNDTFNLLKRRKK